MATATSLTAETIEELMSGWVQVSVVQETQAALLSTFEAILAEQTESLTTWNEETLPALYAETEAASIALDNLVGTVIPDLQVQINGNTEDLQQLNDVIIPDLTAGLNSNYEWIANLNDVVLPELYTQLAANNALVVELNDVTIPALNAEMDALEASVAAIDLTALNASIDALEGKFPVSGDDIQANTITSNNIEAHTITALEIAADTITANEIAADTITANEIAADSITASEIAADTITANEIATDTITANEIATDTITANEIAADTITANEIATDTITANEIAADTITASEIAAHTITALEILADTITANEIATDTITANEIATGTITALEISALTITGDKIAADTIAVTKLIISDLENLAVDGDLSDPTSATWFQMGAGSISRVKPAGEVAYLENTNTYSAQYIYFRNENVFEVKQGDEFYISFEAMTPSSNTVDVVVHPNLAVFDKDGGSQLWRAPEEGPVTFPTNTPWQRIEGTLKVTETGLATAQFNPYGNVGTGVTAGTQKLRIRSIQVRRKNSGKIIVDGTIEGKHVKANTITADQIDTGTITGDLFAGEVIFGGLIRAGDIDDVTGLITGGYAEMGSLGIYTVDSSGEPVFYAPTSSGDGAYLKAHVDLLSADVRDNFTMHGTNNSIATEAELTLSAGVEAPSVPPVLQQVWDQVQFNKTTAVPPHTPNPGYNLGTFAFNPAQVTSMAWDALWGCWTVIQQKSNGFRVWRFQGDGSITNNFGTGRPWVDDWNDRTHAHTCWNDDKNGLATMFLQGDQWYIWDPQYINKIPNSWILNESQGAALTYDTINNQYVLVQNQAGGGGGGTVQTRRFTVNSGPNFPNATSVSTNNFETGSGVAHRWNGAVYGSQSGLANAWTLNCDVYQSTYVFTGAGVLQNDEGSYRCWSKPGASLGFTHNGTSFASVDSAGVLTFYTNWTWLTVDAYVWIGASAADTDAGGTGIHETPVGTMKSISLYRRSKLKITMPETNDSGAADDPDKWRLYFKRGSNVAPTDKTLLKQIGDIGSPTASSSVIISADATGGNPVGGIKGQPTAVNNFPGADPGRIESAGLLAADSLPILQMLGSGAGRWGTLTVDTNGKAVIGGDTGWITATLTSPWTNYGAPYASAAYRRIGNQVYLRGLVKGAGGSTGAVFTLPVGFRPAASDTMFSTVVAEHEGTHSATGDNPGGFTTGSTNSHTHSANPPAMDVVTTVAIANVGSRMNINSSGVVSHSGGAAKAGGVNWMTLDGVTFLVD